MRKSKKVILIEVLSCFLLLAFSLYTSASQVGKEKEKTWETVETAFPVLAENPNPYFFPDDVITVTYDCNRKSNSEEKEAGQIKMLIYREKAFPKGILYSLKGEMEESVSGDDASNQEKEDFEKIYAAYPKKAGRSKAFEFYRGWVGKGRVINGIRYHLDRKQIYYRRKKPPKNRRF